MRKIEVNLNLQSDIQKANNQYKENKKLMEKLKRWKRRDIDALFLEAHEVVFADIDCRECGRCCSVRGPKVNNRDVERLGRFINMSAGKVRKKYIEMDDNNEFIFQGLPCPFLKEDNFCSIYEAKPRDCNQYPYTNLPNMQKNLHETLKNSLICPAIYRMLERIRPEVMK